MSSDLPLLALNLDFYPAHLGELLHSRYKILRNVGNGAHSSVWLVEDTKFHKDGLSGTTQ